MFNTIFVGFDEKPKAMCFQNCEANLERVIAWQMAEGGAVCALVSLCVVHSCTLTVRCEHNRWFLFVY